MVNFLLETEFVTKSNAMYISNIHVSRKEQLSNTQVTKILYNHIKEITTNTNWTNIIQNLDKELTSFTNESTKLDELISKYKHSSSLKTWEDIINLYCLVSVVSQICDKNNCKSHFVSKCIDACSEKHIIQWIITRGGWDDYKITYSSQFADKTCGEKVISVVKNNKILFGTGVITSIMAFTYYFMKK
jgi:hypothetical protein